MNTPSKLTLKKDDNCLLVQFADVQFSLAAEYLRVFSPSAEVRGHGAGQGVLVTGKEAVKMQGLEAQGNYAIRIFFSDGHDSGIYTWEYLRALGENYADNWADYCERRQAKKNGVSVVKWSS